MARKNDLPLENPDPLLASLEGLPLVYDQFGQKNTGLDTPPIFVKEPQYSGESFDGLYEGSEDLLNPEIEKSVDLRDLIGTLGSQDEFNGVLEQLGQSGAVEFEAYSPDSLKVEPGFAEPVYYLNCSDVNFATLSPGLDDTLFPLPVVEEEVGDDGIIYKEPEQNFGSSLEQNIVTISLDQFSTLDSGCILRAIDIAPPQDAVLKSVPVVSSAAPSERQTERQTERQPVKVEKKNTRERLNETVASQPKAKTSSRKRHICDLDKDSEEYRDKRDRNNESVRKSRDKARQRQEETEGRLQTLVTENERLQDRVDSLEKELSILRGLFTNVGAAVPREVDGYLGQR